jgi:hypothetical protein
MSEPGDHPDDSKGTTTMPKQLKKTVMGVMAFAALAVGGAAIAGAATSSTTSTNNTAPPTHNGWRPPPGGGFTSANAPGTAAHENAEKAVTGEAAQKAKAAALASVSGTAGAVSTDFRGSGYEVDITRSDGTKVTVHLDSSFKVRTHPTGGPGMGGPGGPHPGQAPPYGQAPPAG